MRLKNRCFILASAIATVASAAPAGATLIGDLVSVEYHFPDLGTLVETHSTTVQAGPADSVTLLEEFLTPGTVNVEESSVEIDWVPVEFTPGTFNGLVLRDLDFSGAPGPIVGLQIVTDAPTWNDSFASFTGDSIALNFASLGVLERGFTMTVDIVVVPRETPEPGTFALLLLGLSALGIAARVSRRSS
jgi:hypothetical protein